MGHWIKKCLIREMAIEIFKMFRLSAYNLIKANYGGFDDDFLLTSDWCLSDLTKIDKLRSMLAHSVDCNLEFFVLIKSQQMSVVQKKYFLLEAHRKFTA